MKFLLDNSLAPRQARALHALAQPLHSFTHVREKFDLGVPDAEWMLQLQKEGNWIVVSGDSQAATNPHQRAAWQQSGLTVFLLNKSWMKLRPLQLHAKITANLERLLAQAENVIPGSGFSISSSGRLLRLSP